MRRQEFQCQDLAEFDWIAQHGRVGHLGLIDSSGFPRIVPLNFVAFNRHIYFHGALDGEKFEVFRSQPQVTFSIAIPYSTIPSYWIAKDYACPATTYFKSLHIRGQGAIAEDMAEKATALQAFMEKYQPEGGYRPISCNEPMYEKPLQKVAVFRIDSLQIDIKAKFGQNLSPKVRLELIAKLEARNKATDQQTADEIRRTLTAS